MLEINIFSHNIRRFAVQGILCVLVCLSLSVTIVPFGNAQDASSDLPPLRVAQDHAWPPFAFLNDAGEPEGLLIDLWRYYGELLGREVSFELVDWPDTIRLVREGKADLHGGLFPSPERAEILDFTHEFVPLQTYLFVARGLSVANLEAVGDRLVGVTDGSYELEFVKGRVPGLSMRRFPNNEQLVRAALAGEIELFVADYPVALYLLDQLGGATAFHAAEQLYARHLVAAVGKGDRALQRQLDVALQVASPAEVRRISQRWLRSDTVTVVPSWVFPAAIGGGLSLGLAVISLMLLRQRRQLEDLVHERTLELERSEARYRNFFERATHPLFILEGGVFTNCNDAATSFLGLKREQLIGKSPLEISPQAEKDGRISNEQAGALLNEAIVHGATRFEWLHQRPDGTPVWGDVSLTRIVKNPEPIVLVSLHDISDRKLMEAGMLEVLDFSKIEAGKLRLESRPLELRLLLEDTLKTHEYAAKDKGLAFHVSIPTGLPERVNGDAARISQVLNNLLSNAIKFTQTGSVTFRTTILDQSESDLRVRMEVEDTGIGIDAEGQSKLFKKFSQAAHSTTRDFGGSGLGLAICRELVQMMGGRVGVESTHGEGSTFWCELPFRVAATKDQKPLALQPAGASTTTTGPDPVGLILIVEDNAVNRDVASRQLKHLGYDSISVDSGAAALEILRKNTYDLILMDLRMPGMSGIETTEAFRKWELDHKRKPTPIVALTAGAMKGDEKLCLAAGMNDYLTKPLRRHLLAETLKKWI